MMRYKKARNIAALLAGILVIDILAGCALPYMESMAYMEKPATVNASSLNVRSGPGTSYSIVTKLISGAAVTVVDEKTASDGALWYQIRMKGSEGTELDGYVSKSYLKFPASYKSDADFESQLNSEGFPESYKIRLRELHSLYPKWVFRAQNTNLDWGTAVGEEGRVGHSLVQTSSMSSWKSIEEGAFNWDTSTWTGFDGSSWAAASMDIVKYYMDPRNFLDETNVFQFLAHTYDSNSHTIEGLKTMVKGSFLEGAVSGGSSSGESPADPDGGTSSNGSGDNGSDSGGSPSGSESQDALDGTAPTSGHTPGVSPESPHASITWNHPNVLAEYGPGASMMDPSADNAGSGNAAANGSASYVDIIMNAATQSGVNPYVLAAMIIQEQHSSGSGNSISGTVSGYEGYYNFFNIGAYQSDSQSAIQRGLWWASQPGSYGRPWDSVEKSILGGALYYGDNYVKVGQDTFYLKKFNVQGNEIYKHQYMTNVQGAASEGAVYSKAYNDEMKQMNLEFKIPIYNNMPDNPCSQPTTDGSPNNKLSELSVDGFDMTPTYNRDTLEYNLIVDNSVSDIAVRASVIDSRATASGSGKIELQNGSNDVKVAVTAQNGSIREYVIHVVRQDNGPTYSSGAGEGAADTTAGPGGGEANPGSDNGTGMDSSPGGSPQDSNGSSIVIAPDGS